jgi:hypothetical protein
MKYLKTFNENFSNDGLITESIIGKLFDRLGYTNDVLKTSIKQTLDVNDDPSKEELIRKTKELFGESDNKRKLFRIAKELGVLGEIVTALVVVFNIPWNNWTWLGTIIYLILSHDENNIIRKPWKDIVKNDEFFKDDDKKVNEARVYDYTVLPREALKELESYVDYKNPDNKIEVVPDPRVDGTYAVRVYSNNFTFDLLWNRGAYDELEGFTNWPPTSGDLKFFF